MKKSIENRIFFSLLAFSIVTVSTMLAHADNSKKPALVIYSSRQEQLLKPLIDAYKAEHGVEIKVLSDKPGPLNERLKSEGKRSPADILITVDAGNLWNATQHDLLEPIQSKILKANIPSSLQDPDGKWFGFSIRARTIFFNSKTVKPSELSTYEDLAHEKWKGKLCLRSSSSVYNQSLTASFIEAHGATTTQEILKKWVSNLAATPFPDDTILLKAIASGQCAVGISNTYYYGRLIKEDPKLNVAIFWPDQNGRGVHINISGAGIIKSSKNKIEAQKFLEWLSSDKAQKIFADSNMEFPVNPAITPDPIVQAWGTFKQDPINVSIYGKRQIEAVKMLDIIGYK